MRSPWFVPSLLLTLAVLNACSKQTKDTLPYFITPDFTPLWIEKDDPAFASIHQVPAFRFYDQSGDTITDQDIAGKIVVADFFFTICPGICPRLTKNMTMVQSAFHGDSSIVLLSHSVTPDIDSIPRLRQYAESHGVDAGQWHLLTGDRREIYSIARLGYFADEETGVKKGEDEFLHTENFILLDGHRRIRGIYSGTNPAEVERLIEDIKILQNEI